MNRRNSAVIKKYAEAGFGFGTIWIHNSLRNKILHYTSTGMKGLKLSRGNLTILGLYAPEDNNQFYTQQDI
jgi:hypothetical protein